MKRTNKKVWLRLLCAILTGFLLSGSVKAGVTFYVDSQAANGGDGTVQKPFQTLEQGRDAARNRTDKNQPVDILVGDGVYRFDASFDLNQSDSGTNAAPVTFRSIHPQGAILTNARSIAKDRFRPVTDAAVLSRLADAAKGTILVCDLAELGFPAVKPMGKKLGLPLPIPELFVNGERQKISCWPNDGWAEIVKITDPGSQGNAGTPNAALDKPIPPVGGAFTYSEDEPARWNSENGVWLHGFWCFDWASEVIQVESIDALKKEIRLATQHTYGLRQGNPSPRRWVALNLIEEVDQPGEYCVDAKSQKLYWFPIETGDKTNRDSDNGANCDFDIEIAFADCPVVKMNQVSFVRFSGFQIEQSYSNGFTMSNCTDVEINNCKLVNLRGIGIGCWDGTNDRFLKCLVEQTGCGGIHISGGNRKTLERGNCLVEDCVIRGFSQYKPCYANGLLLTGVGHTARHNELSDAPHQAVAVGGNDMLFEYNYVHDVCLCSDDCGAFYKGRNPSCRGNVLRYNYWAHIGSPRGHGNASIYFDDGDGGETVFGNVFYKAGEPGRGSFGTVFCHGGHGNAAENNIFIETKRALGSSPWNDKRWKDYIDAPLWQQRLFQDVDIESPVYLERYPELAGFRAGQPIEKRHNSAAKNVFVKTDVPPSGTWDVDESNWSTSEDPGFVDADRENFLLKPDSEVFKRIPGFQPIPFDKIGPR